MNNKIILKVVSGLTLISMVGYTLPVFAYTKDETVYSKLDANGNRYKTIVSTHIKNTENEEIINDVSDLLNIKNTSGDETFTQDGNTFTWNANKNDIYYQGESQKELPIECNVKYELNGEEISSDEIGGKAGHVKITLQYTNKEEKYVYVNGKQVKMYVPFVVLAGTVLDNENNKNITVSSGKVVNDGTKALVAGIAMPGLQESLGVSKADMEIPSTIEIEMDTEKFETKSIISCVTPKVLEKEDLNIFDNLDKIYSQVNTLKESSEQIVDGANALNEGVQTATTGVTTMRKEVEASVNKLTTDKSAALTDTQLNQIGSTAKTTAEAGVDLQKDTITEEMIASSKLIAEETAYKTALQIAQKTAADTVENTLLQVYATQYLESLGIANPTEAQIAEAIPSIKIAKATELSIAKAQAAATATASIEKEKTTILATADAGVEENRTTISEQAVASAKKIAGTTAQSTATSVASTVASLVKQGALSKVAENMTALTSGLNELETGMNQLNEGSATLAEGITKFNEEGIEKICDYINGDLKDTAERAEKLTELSKEYNNFTMLNKGDEGEVKFIMIIDGVKAKTDSEQDKEEAVVESSNTNNEKQEEKEN